MALKIELKPQERIIIGSTVITNGDHRAYFFIEGNEPILREKDIYTADTANSPAKRIYLAVQLMYLNKDIAGHKEVYFELVKEFIQAAPSAVTRIEAINQQILTGSLYHALKRARDLIDYERELIENAQSRSVCISDDKPEDGGWSGARSAAPVESGG
ncbi:flagellar biosynthesis repressor FlbT [Stappia sp. F7233]|uniref:Flagellar biosynthesis repressor FlbT n=1 Tax=Stappia albiluteola TaxID=2758565 RepID=A0A839AH37_9HYPH|nr:flagellar biosynthesis repressor FlbT [Stappia albiluteola]MBA5778455.1 flagellar biosynthesis repressor FlbT [Stappia albiluteola]